jgi:signal peptidase II
MKKYSHFLVALLVVLLDQITKYLARSFISSFETVKILPFLQLVSVRNEGAAFGMFRSFGNAAFIVISLAAIVFVCYLLIKGREDRLGLSFILGGAAGNLIDRIVFRSVTDFIDVFAGRLHWPAFNIADSALTVGIVILLTVSLFHHRRESSA